jgi:hypothetical protein
MTKVGKRTCELKRIESGMGHTQSHEMTKVGKRTCELKRIEGGMGAYPAT